MKKINFLILLLFVIGISSKLSAQKITKESCKDVQINDKYILQTIITSDENATFFKEFEKGKGKNGLIAISKFDKNIKYIKRVFFKDLINDDITNYTLVGNQILNKNILLLFKKEIDKHSDQYYYLLLNTNLEIVKKTTELYKTNQEMSQLVNEISSVDSSQALFLFGRFSLKFAFSKYNKYTKKLDAVIIDKNGDIKANQSINFDFKEVDNLVEDVAYDNENIFFGIYVGYSYGQNIVYKGTSKKTETQKNNYYLTKYNVAANKLQSMNISKTLENYYVASSYFTLRDGYLYFAGTYNENKLYANGLVNDRFQGHFISKIDTKNDKIDFSDFTLEKTNDKEVIQDKGAINGLFLKKDGGIYMKIENNYESGVSYSSAITLYNYDNTGKMIWKKVIDKEHKGGQLYKGFEFLHSLAFVKNDQLYVIMNENKKNAELPIESKMEENKSWEKGLYCISFIYGDNFEKKNIVFNADESGCEFHDGYNVPVLDEQEKYLIDRRNDVFFNLKQNKIYSIGGIDDKRKIGILSVE